MTFFRWKTVCNRKICFHRKNYLLQNIFNISKWDSFKEHYSHGLQQFAS